MLRAGWPSRWPRPSSYRTPERCCLPALAPPINLHQRLPGQNITPPQTVCHPKAKTPYIISASITIIKLPLCCTPPRPCTALSRRVSGWPRSLASGISHLPNRTVPSCIPRAGVAFLVALLPVTQKDPQAGFRLCHVANSSSSSSSSNSSIKKAGLQRRPRTILPCNSPYIVSSTRLPHHLLPTPFQTTLTRIDCCP